MRKKTWKIHVRILTISGPMTMCAGQTDGPTDRPTDQQTDTPSYRIVAHDQKRKTNKRDKNKYGNTEGKGKKNKKPREGHVCREGKGGWNKEPWTGHLGSKDK